MNTESQISLTLNLTGQLTIDPKSLEQLLRGLQIQSTNPSPVPMMHRDGETKPHQLAYSTKEAAELLGMCPKTIYRLIDRGLLKCSKAVRIKRIPRAEIERFLKETC